MSLPEHVSHSQLQQWLRCGKAYELDRLQHVPKTPSVWQVGGVAIHRAIDYVNHQSTVGAVDSIKATWEQAFEQTLAEFTAKTDVPHTAWPRAGKKDSPEDLAWWRWDGERQLRSYANWLQTAGWRIHTHGDGTVFSEFETTSHFGGVEVVGFLDAIMVSPEGHLVAVDYKSGAKAPTEITQMSLYIRALKREHDLDVPLVAFYMTKEGGMLPPQSPNRYTAEWFDKQYATFYKARQERIFLPRLDSHCFRCDVKHGCYANGGAEAWLYDPDHPQYTPDKENA